MIQSKWSRNAAAFLLIAVLFGTVICGLWLQQSGGDPASAALQSPSAGVAAELVSDDATASLAIAQSVSGKDPAVSSHAATTDEQLDSGAAGRIAGLRRLLPDALVPVYDRLRQQFPQVDLSELYAFHHLIGEKRVEFGFALTPATAAAWRTWLAEVDLLQREWVLLRARQLGISTGGIDSQGRGYALVGFVRGEPRYSVTTNVHAAVTTNANRVRWNEDLDPALQGTIDGRELYVSINDHGEIYGHTEFQLPDAAGSRILLAELPWYENGSRNHMTHVAGTVAAWGYNSNLTGMAPRVWIRALIQQTPAHVPTYGMLYPGERFPELNPRTGELQMMSVVGNTSLGTEFPNTRYTSWTRSFDTVLRDFPYYVHFYAAANSGPDFETLGGDNPIGKNVISIGAVHDVGRDTAGNYSSGGAIASFSSRGPTFDGRIKPDFVANGVGLLSTVNTSGSASYNGTSMASPNAAGSALLLVDYVHQRFPGHFFRSATYKSLLINSADDLGNPGPDYTYGWGLVNVDAAAVSIRRHAENPYQRVLREERLHDGQIWEYTYVSDGSLPVRVSLAWLDLPGDAQDTESEDRAARLINDLDMRIIGPDAVEHQPYLLPFTVGQGSYAAFDPNLRAGTAITGDNFTDPAEQVFIASPQPGSYTIRISHKGALSGSQPQPFSLAVSGMASATAEPAVVDAVVPAVGNGSDQFPMAVTGSGFVLGSEVWLRRAGSPWISAYAIIPIGDRIDFFMDTAGADPGYYDVVVRAPDATESVLENGFLLPLAATTSNRVTLYSNTFSDASGLLLSGDWQVGAPDQSASGGPGSAFSGSSVLGTYLSGNYTNNINISAILPPVSTADRVDVRLDFQRWLGLAFNQEGSPSTRHGDYGGIWMSTDGSNWQLIWANSAAVNDSGWTLQSIALPVSANGHAQLYIGFHLETDSSGISYGWNLDDLQITAEVQGDLLLPPVFTSTPPLGGIQGSPYSYAITTDDEDTAAADLVIEAVDLAPGLVFTDAGDGSGLISGIPLQAGTFSIRLSVADGDYTTWQIYDLEIAQGSVNTPPLITLQEPMANQLLLPLGMGLWVVGAVSDDGLPGSTALLQTWSVVQSPDSAAVFFDDTFDLNTGISFSHAGDYRLVFTADDGELPAQHFLDVRVAENPATAEPWDSGEASPVGAHISIQPTGPLHVGEAAQINASISHSDPQVEPATITVFWDQLNGPDTVNFSDPHALDPLLVFPAAGSYALRIFASHEGLTTFVGWSAQLADFSSWIDDPALGVPADLRGPHDIPARDRMSNLLKFAFALPPMIPAGPNDWPQISDSSADDVRSLSIRFRRRRGGAGGNDTGYAVDGIRYFVEISASLQEEAWSRSGFSLHPEVPPVDNADGTETITLRIHTPMPANEPVFVRLTVDLL